LPSAPHFRGGADNSIMTEIQAAPMSIAPPATDTAPRKSLWRRFEPTVLGTGTFVLLLLVWQFLPDFVPMKAGTKLFFTVPSQIVGTLWQMFATGSIWEPLGVSASAFAVGLFMAIVVGLPLGVLLGRSPTLNAMFDPFITAFNATPRLVFLPLLLLWFGIGMWSKVAVVFLGALFPLLINTYEGVRNADKLLINVVRAFGASEWDIARLVVVPNSLPFIMVGLRLAIGRAVLGVVVSEFFGSQDGLGVVMVRAASEFKVNVVFAGLIIFAVLSLVMTAVVKLIEARLTRWRPSHVNES
jgi:NitT/TauT family transport system permease protein